MPDTWIKLYRKAMDHPVFFDDTAWRNEVWITTKTKSLHRRRGLFYFTLYAGNHIVSLMVKSEDTDQVYEFHREEDTSEANACGAMYAYIYENHLNEVHT